MIKYFCDKCGKEIGEFEAYTILVEAPEIKSWADQYIYERRGYQVCSDCMAKVADFIEPKTTKKFEDEPQMKEVDEMSIKCYDTNGKYWGKFDETRGLFIPSEEVLADRKDEPQAKDLFTDKCGDVWEWRGDAWYCISGDEQTERSSE